VNRQQAAYIGLLCNSKERQSGLKQRLERRPGFDPCSPGRTGSGFGTCERRLAADEEHREGHPCTSGVGFGGWR